MSEEKKLILKMLKEGKISEEEALRLLDAINEDQRTQKHENTNNSNYDRKDIENKIEKFAQNLASRVEGILQKAYDKVKNIQLDYDFDMSYDGDSIISFGNMKSKTQKNYNLDISESESINLDINNFNGSTKLRLWDKDEVLVKSEIHYNDRYVDENYDFVNYFYDGTTLSIKADPREVKKDAYSVNMNIYLPQINYEDINLNSINGSVDIDGIAVNEIKSSTVNGSFWAYNLKSQFIKVNTVNGRIELEDIDIKNSELESVNGSVVLLDITGDFLDLQTVNGKINLEGINIKEINLKTVNGKIYLEGELKNTKTIVAKSLNGAINIESKDFNRPAKIYCKAPSNSLDRLRLGDKFSIIQKEKRELLAKTSDYSEELNDKLDISVKLQNGKMNINI